MSISSALPSDTGSRKFVGPAGKLPAGRQVGSSDYALTHVEGPDAHDAAATPGYPLQIGGVAESTTPSAVADGDAVRAFFDTLGQLGVVIRGTDGALLLPDRAAMGDGASNVSLSRIAAWLHLYNGSTWDRLRGDTTYGMDVDVTRMAPGTGATDLGKAEDAAHSSGDVGVMALTVRTDVPAARATSDGDYAPLEVDAVGSLWVRQQTVSASSDVSLASSASSAQLLAANTSRRGLLLTNTDANAVYLYYGTTASATKFTVKIPSGGYWEMPQPIYTGRIDAIWAADGSGSLIGSEL